MSFWTTLRTSVNQGAASLKQHINDAKSFPEQIQCTSTACLHITPVPLATFNWHCINNHPCSYDLTFCPGCGVTKKDMKDRGLYHPRINCASCNRLLDVPDTKAVAFIRATKNTAPQKFDEFATNMKKEIHNLNKKPDEILCEHCNMLIILQSTANQNDHSDQHSTDVSTKWICTKCFKVNPNSHLYCQSLNCGMYRYINGVKCPQCLQISKVPSKNILVKFAAIQSTLNSKSTQGVSFMLQRPYALCNIPTCKTPILLNKDEIAFLFRFRTLTISPTTTTTDTPNGQESYQIRLNSDNTENNELLESTAPVYEEYDTLGDTVESSASFSRSSSTVIAREHDNQYNEGGVDKQLDALPPSYDEIIGVETNTHRVTVTTLPCKPAGDSNFADTAQRVSDKKKKKANKHIAICHPPSAAYPEARVEKSCPQCKTINFIAEANLERKIKTPKGSKQCKDNTDHNQQDLPKYNENSGVEAYSYHNSDIQTGYDVDNNDPQAPGNVIPTTHPTNIFDDSNPSSSSPDYS